MWYALHQGPRLSTHHNLRLSTAMNLPVYFERPSSTDSNWQLPTLRWGKSPYCIWVGFMGEDFSHSWTFISRWFTGRNWKLVLIPLEKFDISSMLGELYVSLIVVRGGFEMAWVNVKCCRCVNGRNPPPPPAANRKIHHVILLNRIKITWSKLKRVERFKKAITPSFQLTIIRTLRFGVFHMISISIKRFGDYGPCPETFSLLVIAFWHMHSVSSTYICVYVFNCLSFSQNVHGYSRLPVPLTWSRSWSRSCSCSFGIGI